MPLALRDTVDRETFVASATSWYENDPPELAARAFSIAKETASIWWSYGVEDFGTFWWSRARACSVHEPGGHGIGVADPPPIAASLHSLENVLHANAIALNCTIERHALADRHSVVQKNSRYFTSTSSNKQFTTQPKPKIFAFCRVTKLGIQYQEWRRRITNRTHASVLLTACLQLADSGAGCLGLLPRLFESLMH